MTVVESLIAVVVLQAGMIIAPGSDYALMLRTVGRQGPNASVSTAFGFGAGALMMLLAAILGLNTLFGVFPEAVVLIRWGGALWLAWQGVLCFLPHQGGLLDKKAGSFWAGVVNHGLNIEMILFYIAVVSQLSANNVPRIWQLGAALEMAFFTVLWFVFVAFVVGKIPNSEGILNHHITRFTFGVLFMISAVGLVWASY